MKRIFVVMAAVVLLVSACGGGDEAADPTAGASPVATASDVTTGTEPAADCPDLSGDDPFTVTIVDYSFDPSCMIADGKASISVVNEDSVDHTFTIDGTQVDVTIAGGDTFNGESAGLKPGDYEFRCRFHPSMTGSLTVT